MELTLPTRRFSQPLAAAILRLLSWKLDVNSPSVNKYVVVGAPHTSNWDFLYFLLLVHATGIKLNFVAKDSLFHWPLGGVMRRLGGIPVNRRVKNNFVNQMIVEYKCRQQLAITIAPEGTRGKTEYWRTGFYYIALGAKVPIFLGFIDYRNKVIGIGPSLSPSGDIQSDFTFIRKFYATKTGRHPGLQGNVNIRPQNTDL